MVAIYNIDDLDQNPKTLGDWVKNVRIKRMQMKRRLRSGGNLRICAILSTALMSAELELRRKQQERFQKWLEFQTQIDKNCNEFQPRDQLHHHFELAKAKNNAEESCKQSEEITKLWKCELSDLDNFMRSISSSNNYSNENSKNYQENLARTQPIKVTS